MAVLKYKDEDGVWQELPVGGDTEIVGTDGIEVTKGSDGKVTVSGSGCVKKIKQSISSYGYSYGIAADGNTSDIKKISVFPEPASIVFRDSGGRTRVALPVEHDEATNKKYVDGQKNDILTNLPRYHHYLAITIPLGTIYYDYIDSKASPIEMDNKNDILSVPDIKLIPLVILRNGYYGTVSGLVYLNNEGEVKVISYGSIWNGTAMEYIQLLGETATNISDSVVDIYGR